MLTRLLDVPSDRSLRVLCIGAHSDDIEIGCGGTLLTLAEQHDDLDVMWVVFGAADTRSVEARNSAEHFLQKAGRKEILIASFRDGFFPFEGAAIKEFFEARLKSFDPDLIFTHHRFDRHQDHRLLSDLTWNTFRNHLILEYEIPKYDGDTGQPNLYITLSQDLADRKVRGIVTGFPSQHGKHWFSEETFRGLMRLRGVEAAASSGYAEAFFSYKLVC